MGCCCIKENEKSKHEEENEKFEQETTDFRLKKGITQINILYKDLTSSDATTVVTTCDLKGYSPRNPVLEKQPSLSVQLSGFKHKLGYISKIQNDRTYLFMVLPLYTGEKDHLELLKQLVRQLIDMIANESIESIAIEDIGVKRFGFPRQVAAQIIVEGFAYSLHRMNALKSLDFMLMDVESKLLFEQEVQARKEKLKKTSSISNEPTDPSQLSVPLLN